MHNKDNNDCKWAILNFIELNKIMAYYSGNSLAILNGFPDITHFIVNNARNLNKCKFSGHISHWNHTSCFIHVVIVWIYLAYGLSVMSVMSVKSIMTHCHDFEFE